jgi:uncharacterized protein (TIGR03382 family)
MSTAARLAFALLLALLWVSAPSSALAGGGDDDDSSVIDDDDVADDDDSSVDTFVSSEVPLDERVLGGGCEDGQSCDVGDSSGSSLPLLLLGIAVLRRRR